jgi:hypothetical protein
MVLLKFKIWNGEKIKKRRVFIEPPKNKTILAGIDPRLKQRALDRLAILREFHNRLFKLRKPKTKTKIIEDFLSEFNSGILYPDETAKSIKHIGRATLYNWLKAYQRYGLMGLVDKFKTRLERKGKVTFRYLQYPIELKFPGPPKRSGKAFFLDRIKRRWKNSPLECPIGISIFYSMPIPKGTKMPRRMKMLRHQISHIGKPTLNALDCFMVNCLRGVVFEDCSQIVKFHSEKKFAWWPQTRILIRAFNG